MTDPANWRLCVAPMMDWTDRHCRYFHRLLAPRARLYTEMVTTGAILHGDRDRLLGFDPAEHPVALQLGGSEPDELARAARIGRQFGYDEINLNCGCPSDRVQRGRFGACLMLEPERVADCVQAMREAVDVPVTVKCRIGVDEHDDEGFLLHFVEQIAAAGADALIVHARKAWLKGLSPKQNREIPPLMPNRVARVREAFPGLPVIYNGGVGTLEDALSAARRFDGVMLGRGAYQTPWLLAEVHAALFGGELPDRRDVIQAMVEYARCSGVPRVASVARHMLGLYQGLPGARHWRRHLSQNMHKAAAGPELLIEAADRVSGVAGRIQHPGPGRVAAGPVTG
ncbi:MAG: tRNA dihydrouridine(20/20a) synthase DusA [Wenzhouxiangellaceae bacterium]